MSPRREVKFGWKKKVSVDGPRNPLVSCNPYGDVNFFYFQDVSQNAKFTREQQLLNSNLLDYWITPL